MNDIQASYMESTTASTDFIAIPSKTFLLGEYAALEQGPAILAATMPCFELHINTAERQLFHPDSPAARFIEAGDPAFKLTDPHHGAGGFGASSAEFIAAYLCRNDVDITDWDLMRRAYQVSCKPSSSTLPSGYDVLAQYAGKITLIGEEGRWLDAIDWPFEELSFILARTKIKIPTHDHLANLPAFDCTSFNEITDFAQAALLDARCDDFLGAIVQYAQELEAAKLTCTETIEILNGVHQLPGILAAKGCGCLGADVIALFCNQEDKMDIIREIAPRGLQFVADETNLHAGVCKQLPE
jgi:mevalonate kinase